MRAPKAKSAAAEFGGDSGYSTRQDGGSMASQVYDRLMQQILDMQLPPFRNCRKPGSPPSSGSAARRYAKPSPGWRDAGWWKSCRSAAPSYRP